MKSENAPGGSGGFQFIQLFPTVLILDGIASQGGRRNRNHGENHHDDGGGDGPPGGVAAQSGVHVGNRLRRRYLPEGGKLSGPSEEGRFAGL